MDESNLIFLGTAGDTTAVSKQLRASGGIVLIHNNNQFHFDPGPGSLTMYKKMGINPRSTIATVVTNNNINHCGDINAVVSAMTHDGLDNRGVLIAAKSIIQGTETENPILWKRFSNYLERNIVLNSGERVGINEVDIMAIPAKGDDPTGIGLRVTTSKYTVCYTSDTKYNPSLVQYYEDCDILIIKNVHPITDEQTDRINAKETIQLIEAIRPRLAILTGFGVKMLNSDPLYLAREIHAATRIEVIAAHDGLVLNPANYCRNKVKRYDTF